jgi:2-oxoglutarate ferredoxin oxidoreductase subunit alpha
MSVATKKKRTPVTKPATEIDEHIVEILSDSGEGAQKCGQSLGAIAARLGYGTWTVEIIPAEIQPPARSVDGAPTSLLRSTSRYSSVACAPKN